MPGGREHGRPVVLHGGDGHLPAAVEFQKAVHLARRALGEVAFDKGGDLAGPLVAFVRRVIGRGLAELDGAVDKLQVLAEDGVLVVGVADIRVGMADQVDCVDLGHGSDCISRAEIATKAGKVGRLCAGFLYSFSPHAFVRMGHAFVPVFSPTHVRPDGRPHAACGLNGRPVGCRPKFVTHTNACGLVRK